MAELPRFFSPSAAGTYRQCPLRWKFRYIDKLPDPPGEAALVGTFAHRVLEHLCDESADARTTDRAKELAGEAWRSISMPPHNSSSAGRRGPPSKRSGNSRTPHT